jgi:exodeoxyribonuclease VII large subunit
MNIVYKNRLVASSPSSTIKENKNNLFYIIKNLQQTINFQVKQKQSDFKFNLATLDSISPLKTLNRGYAIIKDKNSKKVITTKNALKKKQQILIKLKDGEANAQII